MNKLFLIFLFLTLSNITKASISELPYQIEYSLIDSLVLDEDTVNISSDDSIWMMGNRKIIFRAYKDVLYNNTLVKVVFNDGRESEKGVFIKMLNEDSFLFETQYAITKIIALNNIKRVRKNLVSRKVRAGVIGGIGVAIFAGGVNIALANPGPVGILFGVMMVGVGIGYIIASPFLLIQKRFNPQAANYTIVKISEDQLKNSFTTKHAMNKALRAKIKAQIALDGYAY